MLWDGCQMSRGGLRRFLSTEITFDRNQTVSTTITLLAPQYAILDKRTERIFIVREIIIQGDSRLYDGSCQYPTVRKEN